MNTVIIYAAITDKTDVNNNNDNTISIMNAERDHTVQIVPG